MTNKTQNILIFLVMAFLIAIVVIWFYVLNEGKLIINAEIDNYTIYSNNLEAECINDPCEIKLKIGRYNIRFEKEGFITATSQTNIVRGGISAINFEAKKQMEIKQSEVIPQTDKLTPEIPKDLNKDDIIAYEWNTNKDKIIFLDANDNRLKIKELNKDIKLITTLKNVSEEIKFYFSPDNKYIFANENEGIYFIEIELGSRLKKDLEFTPTYIKWSPLNNFIILNNENNSVYKIDWDTQEALEIEDISINLEKSVWINENTLITFDIDTEKNQSEIWSYNFKTSVTENLTKKFDFPLKTIIFNKDNKTVYFLHEREGGWYEMEM